MKTVKLWKIFDQPTYDCDAVNSVMRGEVTSTRDLPLPRRRAAAVNELGVSSSTTAKTKRVFQGSHTYFVHSVSLCSDGMLFLSADDLTVNLWSLDRSDTAFSK